MVNIFLHSVILFGILIYSIPMNAQSYYTAWEKRYASPLGVTPGVTDVSAMTLDPSGNIIVASIIKENVSEATRYLFSMIKYDAAGNQLWAANSSLPNGNKNISYLKTDDLGNIYMAGDYEAGPDQDHNCIVIKYNPAGVQQWIFVYDGNSGNDITNDLTSSIDVDTEGNIYLAGKSMVAGSWSMLTVKIRSDGILEWKTLVQTLSNQLTCSIAMDNLFKKIYVAGHGAIVCYDIHGAELWRASSGVNPKIMLNGGNLYLGSAFTHAMDLVKLNPITGETIWALFRSANTYAKYNIDKAGNVFSCIQKYNSDSTVSNWIILKYNSSGVLQWERNFEHFIINNFNFPRTAIETDDSLNVYIAGETVIKPPPAFNYIERFTTLVYDKNGSLLQENNYLNPDNYLFNLANYNPLAVSKNSTNYYITGKEKYFANPIAYNFVTINYRSTGLLPAPAALTVEAVSSNRINLNWKYNSSVPTGFIIERDFVGCSEYFYIDSVAGNNLSYTDTLVEPGTFYCYRVYAYTDSTQSMYSNSAYDTTFQTVGISGNTNIIPQEYKLHQNYPNPFNPVTNISFDSPKAGIVTLKVYNVVGEELTSLVSGFHPAGTYSINWDASQYSSGVYFYKIESGSFVRVKKMILLK